MKSYIEYKVKFMATWGQGMNEGKVDKLFITIYKQIPSSRLIIWFARTRFGTFYKFNFYMLGSIVYDAAYKTT